MIEYLGEEANDEKIFISFAHFEESQKVRTDFPYSFSILSNYIFLFNDELYAIWENRSSRIKKYFYSVFILRQSRSGKAFVQN